MGSASTRGWADSEYARRLRKTRADGRYAGAVFAARQRSIAAFTGATTGTRPPQPTSMPLPPSRPAARVTAWSSVAPCAPSMTRRIAVLPPGLPDSWAPTVAPQTQVPVNGPVHAFLERRCIALPERGESRHVHAYARRCVGRARADHEFARGLTTRHMGPASLWAQAHHRPLSGEGCWSRDVGGQSAAASQDTKRVRSATGSRLRPNKSASSHQPRSPWSCGRAAAGTRSLRVQGAEVYRRSISCARRVARGWTPCPVLSAGLG